MEPGLHEVEPSGHGSPAGTSFVQLLWSSDWNGCLEKDRCDSFNPQEILGFGPSTDKASANEFVYNVHGW